ncbi:DUF6166 domain-containing protein [Phytomonospora sp. NPDC050363]|uniref:DUF6166 domain-containing protein n=1 Tax=Phytomonospora sp. NPDC050363 TaxID=3155642 RepID=UPI0034023891
MPNHSYHGIPGGVDAAGNYRSARILVETAEPGPTERERARLLRELVDEDGYGWGYNGSGTSNAAAAILADALELGDPDTIGMSMAAHPENRVLTELREDFCVDVLAQACDEWRMSRGAILRWARGWYLQHGDPDLPTSLAKLPPVPPY